MKNLHTLYICGALPLGARKKKMGERLDPALLGSLVLAVKTLDVEQRRRAMEQKDLNTPRTLQICTALPISSREATRGRNQQFYAMQDAEADSALRQPQCITAVQH